MIHEPIYLSMSWPSPKLTDLLSLETHTSYNIIAIARLAIHYHLTDAWPKVFVADFPTMSSQDLFFFQPHSSKWKRADSNNLHDYILSRLWTGKDIYIHVLLAPLFHPYHFPNFGNLQLKCQITTYPTLYTTSFFNNHSNINPKLQNKNTNNHIRYLNLVYVTTQ